MQAIELARRHGWTEEPAAGIASLTLASVEVGQRRPEGGKPGALRYLPTSLSMPEIAADV